MLTVQVLHFLLLAASRMTAEPTTIPPESLASLPVSHVIGTAEAGVQAGALSTDPGDGRIYAVTFAQRLFHHPPDEDGYLDSVRVWRLLDRGMDGLGETVILDSVPDFSGTPHDARPLRNFQVGVTAPEYPIKSAAYTPSANNPFAGVGFGTVFDGMIEIAQYFFGSSLRVEDLVSVELQFNPAGGQQAYSYQRDPASACSPNSYAFEGIGTVPFTAWDVSDPAHPRQINVAFVQNCGDTSDSSPPRWLPTDGNTGGREYLFPLLSSYQVSPPLPQYLSAFAQAGTMDQLYAIAARRPNVSIGPHNGDVLSIQTYRPILPEEEFRFVFRTDGPVAAGDVELPEAFSASPNPSLGAVSFRFRAWEADGARILIYNQQGALVRALIAPQSGSGERGLVWDGRDERGHIAAAGVFFARLEAGGRHKTIRILHLH